MNVVFLLPGPVYNICSPAFRLKYTCLSRFLSGYIIATSDSSVESEIDNFHFTSCQYGVGKYPAIKYVLFCLKTIIKLKSQGVKIDLVVTYDPLKTGLVGCLIKSFLRTKLVVEVNGVYTSPFVWEGAASGLFNRLKQRLVPAMIKVVLQEADGIKLLFSHQIDGFDVDCSKKIVSTYSSWVNTDLFVNRGEKKEILFAGFPYGIKGVDILIRAFKLAATNHPEWTLKILGWFPDRRALDAEMGGHPQIFHHPSVPASEMPEHVGRCGFFVLPSRTEAMGRVLLEAMAAGKARLGTCVDGIPTVIEHGVDGFLVEPENVEALAEKMDLLMDNDKLRRRLGEASALRASKEFTSRRYLQSTMAFYNKVAESSWMGKGAGS